MKIKLAISSISSNVLLVDEDSSNSFKPIAVIESKEVSEEIINRVNAYDKLIKKLKECSERFGDAAHDANSSLYDKYAKDIEDFLRQVQK